MASTEAKVLSTLQIEQVRRLGLTPQAAPKRLVEPLAHARDCLQWAPGTGHQRRFARDAAGVVLVRCGELGRSYWGWSHQDWADLIDRSGAEFRRRWGGQIGPNARPFVIAYAYLLGGFTAFEQVGRFQRPALAHRIFGEVAVDDAVGKVLAILGDWGYQRRPSHLTSAVCQILLLNRSPRLEDLSSMAQAAIRATPAMQKSEWVSDLHGIHRAVAALGHADPPPRPRHGTGPTAIEGTTGTWAGWVERWHATSTLTPKVRASYRSVLAKIGRWLAAEHPEATAPEHWTRQTCASWVTAVDRMTVGLFRPTLPRA